MSKAIIRIAAATILTAAALSGCRVVDSRKALKECKFNLEDVVIKDINLADATFLVKVKVDNPNDVEVILDRFDYKLYSNKNVVAEGSHLNQEKIAPGTVRVVDITMKTPLKNLGKGIITQLRDKGNVTYTLLGTVYIKTFLGDLKIPVELRKKY